MVRAGMVAYMFTEIYFAKEISMHNAGMYTYYYIEPASILSFQGY